MPLFGRVLLDAGLSPEAIALYRLGLALPLALIVFPRRSAALWPVIALAGAGLAGGRGWTAYLGTLDEVPVASAGVFYMSYPAFLTGRTIMIEYCAKYQVVARVSGYRVALQRVLSGFWSNLAAHLERSPLNHSDGYGPVADRPTCFASLPQNPGAR